MADGAILEMNLQKCPPDFQGTSAFSINRHIKDIKSKGFIYVPIFSWLEDSDS